VGILFLATSHGLRSHRGAAPTFLTQPQLLVRRNQKLTHTKIILPFDKHQLVVVFWEQITLTNYHIWWQIKFQQSVN